MEVSESEAAAASRDCFRVVPTTVAARAGSSEPPQAEQDWRVKEFSVAQAGQVIIDQFLKAASLGNPYGTGSGANASWISKSARPSVMSVPQCGRITASLRWSMFSGFTDTLNHNASGRKQQTVPSLAGGKP